MTASSPGPSLSSRRISFSLTSHRMEIQEETCRTTLRRRTDGGQNVIEYFGEEIPLPHSVLEREVYLQNVNRSYKQFWATI